MTKLKFCIALFALNFHALLFSQTGRPIVTDIHVSSSNSKINLEWTLPAKTEGKKVTCFQIYRSTRPITSTSELMSMKPVAEVPYGTVTYIESITDNSEYYYAVISLVKNGMQNESELYYDEELDIKTDQTKGTPYFLVLPGVNATTEGAKIRFVPKKEAAAPKAEEKEPKKYENRLREQPLPYIDVLGDNAESNRQINPETKDKALSLLGKTEKKQPEILEVYIFEEDLVSPSGGDEYLLFEVLRSSFIQGNFSKSTADLKRFLAQNRSKKVSDRANFYLGESYYFTGNYPLALSQFLGLEETFPALTHKWIESTLNLFNP